MQRLDFSESEIVEPFDLTAIGTYARDGVEHLTGDAIGYPNHWAGFTVSVLNNSATVVRVSTGRLLAGAISYAAVAPIDIDLMLQLPGIAPNRRWVGLIAQGDEVTTSDVRDFIIDADTGERVPRPTPKLVDRRIDIVKQVGEMQIAADPTKPEVPGNQCCIAFVLLGTTGIIEIVPGTDWRARTLYEVEGRVRSLEVTLVDTIARTSALETNLANIIGRLNDIPRKELMFQLQTDVAMLRRVTKLPDAARNYWYSPGLNSAQWNKASPHWKARVREGIRHSYAQIVDRQLKLAQPGNPALRISDNLALPAWTEVAKVVVDGTGSSKDISSQQHTVVTAKQNAISKTSISYGPSFGICENQAEWGNLANVKAGEIFTIGGQKYVADGYAQGVLPDQAGALQNYGAWNADPQSIGHKGYAVRKVQVNTWTETYWTYETKEYGINGSVYGQTFLNSQPGILTSIEFKFSRVSGGADAAPVHVILVECDSASNPIFDRVIATSERSGLDLKAGYVKFPITPALLDQGKRYVALMSTVGNHAVATVAGNKFAQGSLIWMTDGSLVIGDPTYDFCMKLNYARFESLISVIEFDGLECPLGMTELQLLYSGWAPAGTSARWEIRPFGEEDWQPIEAGDPAPLNGLPAQCGLRVILVSTTDLAPAILLDSSARSVAMRVNPDMQAVSETFSFGFSSTAITMVTVLDDFDANVATYTPRLLVGGAFVDATASTIDVDRDKPSRRIVKSAFSLGTAAIAAVAAPATTTTALTKVPFVQDITLIAA